MENQKKITSATSRIFSTIKPEYIMRQAVNEMESGQISIQEAMVKYQVKKMETIQNWITRFATDKNFGRRRSTSVMTRRQAVLEIETGALTEAEASRKYNVGMATISDWKKKYSCGMSNNTPQEKMKTDAIPPKETKQQEKIIQEMKLRIAALETMIDLAEEEYKISIRKKHGTRQ